MNYTRGTDITSALKYLYQSKYGIDTAVLAECHSFLEVIRVAEMSQIPGVSSKDIGGIGIDAINAIGDFYKHSAETASKPTVDRKKGKRKPVETSTASTKTVEETNA